MSSKILSIPECTKILKYFPNIELSYETISHKKVSESYKIALAIPQGKKFYAWFSFLENDDMLFIMELNKEKKITNILSINIDNYDKELFYGTLFYGVILLDKHYTDSPIFPENDKKKKFIIEDIFNYRGIPFKKNTFSEKLPWIHDFLKKWKNNNSNSEIDFFIPAIWHYDNKVIPDDNINVLPNEFKNLPYCIHHIQYRCLNIIAPFLNFTIAKNFCQSTNVNNNLLSFPQFNVFKADFSKPQYRNRTIFKVTADLQYDIYHLFAYGKNKISIYYNIAYIPNYKTSVFMNSLFRNIKENRNIDYIEESDDEDDFQNTMPDKYVDLQKSLFIEFQFNYKFKKWVPLRVAQQPCKIVHISML